MGGAHGGGDDLLPRHIFSWLEINYQSHPLYCLSSCELWSGVT